MTQVVTAIFENGVLRPLEHLNLAENQQVRVIVETTIADDDPLAGLRASIGIRDLAENFDEYRSGRRSP